MVMAISLCNTYISVLKFLHNPMSAKDICVVMLMAISLCNTYIAVLKVHDPMSAIDIHVVMVKDSVTV